MTAPADRDEGGAGDGPPPGDAAADAALAADELSLDEVRSLLRVQGFAVPDADVREITVRLNGLIAGLVAYDAFDPHEVEPWDELPAAGRHA